MPKHDIYLGILRPLMLCFALTTGLCQGINAQERKPASVIKVKGESRIKKQPDTGVLMLSINHVGLDMSQTMGGLEKKNQAINKLIKDAGLSEKEIQTTDYRVTKNVVYRKGASKDSGYVAMQRVEVKFLYKKETVATILTTFSGAKSDFSMDFRFMLSDTMQKNTEARLLREAVYDAKSKAEVLATAAGVKLRQVKDIWYGQPEGNVHAYMGEGMMMRSAMADENQAIEGFTPQPVEMSDQVVVVWEIE